MTSPRIVSLHPAATAWLAAFGAGDLLVGGTPACRTRIGRSDLPVVTAGSWTSPRSRSLQVGEPLERSPGTDLDVEALRALEPDLVIYNGYDEAWTGDLAHAVSGGVRSVETWPWDAQTYRDVLELVLRLGRRIGRMDAAMKVLGDRESELRAWRDRIGIHRRAPDERLQRTAVLTSLEPPVLAAGWMNELVDRAALVLAGPASGAPAAVTDWVRLEAVDPSLVVVALPGLDLASTARAVRGVDRPLLHPGERRRVLCLDPAGAIDEAGPGLHETIVDLAAVAWRLDGRETAGRILELSV